MEDNEDNNEDNDVFDNGIELMAMTSPNPIENIKSDYFIQNLFGIIQKKRAMEIIRYSKRNQKRLKLDFKDYKEYSELYSTIEIEVRPIQKKEGYFIRISDDDMKYCHIYFNNNREKEIKRTVLNKSDRVAKIDIILDYQIKTFNRLFYDCKCIKSVYFKKFSRGNIYDMNGLFLECSSLKDVNLSILKTSCVTDMSGMFYGCSSLEELNLSNFDTKNVTNMRFMFFKCSKLKELNLSNFNTTHVENMRCMFYECTLLKELNISNFKTNDSTDMKSMFSHCTDTLKNKMRGHPKCLRKEAFDDY